MEGGANSELYISQPGEDFMQVFVNISQLCAHLDS